MFIKHRLVGQYRRHRMTGTQRARSRTRERIVVRERSSLSESDDKTCIRTRVCPPRERSRALRRCPGWIMPVTRADATPPLIPAVLSAKHYVTLTIAINLVYVFTRTALMNVVEQRTKSREEAAAGPRLIGRARREVALSGGSTRTRVPPLCPARVDAAPSAGLFLFFSTPPPSRPTGSPAARSFLSPYNVRVRCTGCVS